MKKLHKILIAIFIALSVCGNIYYFGNEELKKREQQSFNKGVVFVFQQAIETGEVSLKTEQDKTIILKLQ